MKILNMKNVKPFNDQYRNQVLFSCFTFCVLLQSIMFLRAIKGSAKLDWGYSEFLINYSAGFIRRGLPGTFLQWTDKTLGISPYIFLSVILSLILLLTTLMFFYLITNSKVNSLTIVIISFHPLLLNSPFLSVVMFRKDLLIIFGLISHAFFVKLFQLEKITIRGYYLFLVGLILYSQIILLSHEITILFILAHFFLINIIYKCLIKQHREILKWLTITFFFLQIVSFLIISNYYGTKLQAITIIQKMPARFELGNVNAILSVANLPENQIASVMAFMFEQRFVPIFFIVWFIAGPVAIHLILSQGALNLHFRYVMALLPVFLLFILGVDWGRWIILIAFTVFALRIIESNIPISGKMFNRIKQANAFGIFNLTIFISVYSLGFMFTLVRIPIYKPTEVSDVWSGIAEKILIYLP